MQTKSIQYKKCVWRWKNWGKNSRYSYKKTGGIIIIESYIFDLDDTLYPEKEFVISGFKEISNYVNKTYGIDKNHTFSILEEDFNKGVRKTNFNILLKKIKLDERIIPSLIKIYREHKPTIHLYKDAENLLNDLKNKKKIGLITDGIPITQQNKINALDIKSFFQKIIINDIDKTNKLQPQSFLEMINSLQTTAEACIYIGDNPAKDFFIPKKLGMKTIQIKRQGIHYENIKKEKQYQADTIIDNLRNLCQQIE